MYIIKKGQSLGLLVKIRINKAQREDPMYFYEVVKKCDIDELVCCFLNLCTNSPDIDLTEKCIRSAISDMTSIRAIKSKNEIIIIERVQTENEDYDNVYMLDKETDIKYGLEINPWKHTLGFSVDENNLSDYGYEKYASLVLWEMTWFGYDEDTIQTHVKSWETE